MNCKEATERLPWLANGTLEAGERAQVERHLAECEGCRAEYREVAELLEEGFGHPSAEAMVSYVYGGLDGAEREAMRRHIEECASCGEEEAMARKSKEGMPKENGRGVPWLAIAAGILLAVAGGAIWANREGVRRQEAVEARMRGMEQEMARLRQPTAQARVVDLMPEDFRERSAGEAAVGVVEGWAGETLLLLNSRLPRAAGCQVQLWRDKQEIWRTSGVERGRNGEFVVRIPGGYWRAGEHQLRVECGPGRETYRLQVK